MLEEFSWKLCQRNARMVNYKKVTNAKHLSKQSQSYIIKKSKAQTYSLAQENTMALPNFDALRDLHDSANDLLHSSMIKREIEHQGQEKWVHDVSETSLRMLEVCTTTKDVLLLVKDHLHDLKSTFRRISVGDDNKFTVSFHCQRKKLKKEILKRLHSLKGMKLSMGSDQSSESKNNLMVVVNMLREVKVATMSIVESLTSLMLMPSPNNKKLNKGYFFGSKLMRVNSFSSWEKCDAMTLQCMNKRLEAVEIVIADVLEGELECIIRRLIRTRVSLLNILTC
ncbi:hypothetical protein RDI58_012168 [Solanum bulbocastanum]|uniref:Uncharacterized protein n=1 Tax=Solanum bulbocastanum TaxID=147425 RepID=A0AAN8TYA1_SOLBU